MKKLLIIFTALMLTACGSPIEGTYGDKLGLVEYEFRPSGKVYLRTLGTETEFNYRVDGNKVIIELPNDGNQVFNRLDNGNLQGPLNISLEKKK